MVPFTGLLAMSCWPSAKPSAAAPPAKPGSPAATGFPPGMSYTPSVHATATAPTANHNCCDPVTNTPCAWRKNTGSSQSLFHALLPGPLVIRRRKPAPLPSTRSRIGSSPTTCPRTSFSAATCPKIATCIGNGWLSWPNHWIHAVLESVRRFRHRPDVSKRMFSPLQTRRARVTPHDLTKIWLCEGVICDRCADQHAIAEKSPQSVPDFLRRVRLPRWGNHALDLRRGLKAAIIVKYLPPATTDTNRDPHL